MSLEPCKVCGVLNSSEEEICLSCGFPTKGRKRPVVFQIAAIILVLVFVIPLITTLLSLIKPQQETLPTNTKTSLKF
ncbi:hypothetical protein NIES267_03410 [Calothrix parasitica NIES-267]|uniref:Uncharacterized protein n=1 Tax=Calothrix parasitica NIES-267 TaxID=1973488 RepID=A0A1Z4LI10_9CYAN|nr:hypothetical protein NIES267_03410 [Calothrix parasitica NIES-267]